ncbi:MAG: hypothetical protein PCFJNLEI_01969 [Verrucomicrobiae bacterium]|nr:hypothetical protein [Verrucomicrobiae bacterium]
MDKQATRSTNYRPAMRIVFLLLLAAWSITPVTVGLAKEEPVRIIAILNDGSRLVGETALANLPVNSPTLGQLQIPLAKIRQIKFNAAREAAAIALANGDKLEGVTKLTSLKLTAVFGAVTIPVNTLAEIQVTGQLGAVPTEGLVLHFPFDDDNAQIAADQSPSELRGEIHGARFIRNGRIGGALQFNGNADYVVVRHSPTLDRLEREATVAAWIKIDADAPFSDAALPHLISKGATFANLYADFALTLAEDTGRLTWEYSDQRNRPIYSKATPLPRDEWHHVAATFQDGTIKLYINGQLAGSDTGSSKSLRTSGQPLYIGCRYLDPFTMPFKGSLDEVLIYNRALTDSEVQSLATPAIKKP